MDSARKMLTDKELCHFCLHYHAIRKKGRKTSRGQCDVTGTIKQRTDKCKKSFCDKGQMKLI